MLIIYFYVNYIIFYVKLCNISYAMFVLIILFYDNYITFMIIVHTHRDLSNIYTHCDMINKQELW